jgi:hypothetical protein
MGKTKGRSHREIENSTTPEISKSPLRSQWSTRRPSAFPTPRAAPEQPWGFMREKQITIRELTDRSVTMGEKARDVPWPPPAVAPPASSIHLAIPRRVYASAPFSL